MEKFSKGLVPENSRLAAEEGKLSKKTSLPFPAAMVLFPPPTFQLIPIWSPGELLFRAQDLFVLGEILCLDYVHHVTAKFKTLFQYMEA